MGHPIDIVERMVTPQTGSGVRLEARQRLEDVQHKGRGDHRRDEIDERQGEQPCNHDPTQENAAGEPAAHSPGRPHIEPSERDHFEIPPPEKISVQREEEKEIYPGNQQINRKRQKVEQQASATSTAALSPTISPTGCRRGGPRPG